MMVEVFDGAVVERQFFLLTSNVHILFAFGQ